MKILKKVEKLQNVGDAMLLLNRNVKARHTFLCLDYTLNRFSILVHPYVRNLCLEESLTFYPYLTIMIFSCRMHLHPSLHYNTVEPFDRPHNLKPIRRLFYKFVITMINWQDFTLSC